MSKRKTDEELTLITTIANIRKELASKGIDFNSDNGKLTCREILELHKQIWMKEVDEKIKVISDEHEVEEKKEEAILKRIKVQDQTDIPKVMKITTKATKEKEEMAVKPKKRRKTWIKIVSCVIGGSIALSGIVSLGVLSSKVGEKLYYRHVKNEKMAPYEELIDHAVLSSIHEMSKYRDVGGGEREHYYEYWLEYGKIAKAIKESDNPDLALYVLYNNYGKSKASIYEGITTETCKRLEFSNENGEKLTGDLYDYASGFNKGNKTDDEILEEYDKACDAELKYGNDDILDNMTSKIFNKKLTISNTKIKETM